jgi:hypothetical protein
VGRCGFLVHSGSAIDLPPVTHAVHAHDANLIGNFVNNAVVAHADAPVVFASGQLAATGRARVRRKRLNRLDYAVVNLGGETGEVFLSSAFKQEVIHGYLWFRSAR